MTNETKQSRNKLLGHKKAPGVFVEVAPDGMIVSPIEVLVVMAELVAKNTGSPRSPKRSGQRSKRVKEVMTLMDLIDFDAEAKKYKAQFHDLSPYITAACAALVRAQLGEAEKTLRDAGYVAIELVRDSDINDAAREPSASRETRR